MKIDQLRKRIIGYLAAVGIILFGLSACMQPADFVPSLSVDGINVNLEVSGEVEARFVDTAVLWVVNTTTSVDIEELTVERVDNAEGYPKKFCGQRNGSSLASYHEATDIAYDVIVDYIPATPFPEPLKPAINEENSRGKKTIRMQMPRAKDYVLYVYRDDVTQEIIFQPGEADQYPGAIIDKAVPPAPPPISRENSNPLIIKNLTMTADITKAEFVSTYDNSTFSYGDTIKGGDMNVAFLPEDAYRTTVSYQKTDSSSEAAVDTTILVVGSAQANSLNTLYAYFYMGNDGNYYLTQQWPPLAVPPAPSDGMDDNSTPAGAVRFNITNDSFTTRIVGLSFEKYGVTNSEVYYKTDAGFVHEGPVGNAGGTGAVIFTRDEAAVESGRTYTIHLIGEDWRDEHFVMMDIQRQLYVGKSLDLVVTEDLVSHANVRIEGGGNSGGSGNGNSGGSGDQDGTEVRIASAGKKFWMSTDSEPAYLHFGQLHEVTLTKDYYIGKYPVTQSEFKTVMGYNSSYFSAPHSLFLSERIGDRPVEHLTWYETLVYCNKLSIKEGLDPVYQIGGSTNPDDWKVSDKIQIPTGNDKKWNEVIMLDTNGYRLPTEAEWEYACWAGKRPGLGELGFDSQWTYGNVADGNYMWYHVNSHGITHEVGQKKPNAWGLYDMHGNVYEWCWDRVNVHSPKLSSEPQTNPTGSDNVADIYHAIRGGSYCNNLETRTAFRYWFVTYAKYAYVGFRVVRTIY